MVLLGPQFHLTSRSLGFPWSCSTLPEVVLQSWRSLLGLFLWRMLAWFCSKALSGLDLLLWSSLAQACSSRGCWFRPVPMMGGHLLRPASVVVTGSGLLQWWLLVQACSGRGHWPGPGPLDVATLGLLLLRLLTQASKQLLGQKVFKNHSSLFSIWTPKWFQCKGKFLFETVSLFNSGCPGTHSKNTFLKGLSPVHLLFPEILSCNWISLSFPAKQDQVSVLESEFVTSNLHEIPKILPG